MLLFLFLTYYVTIAQTDKCYSCSSAQLHLRWPKDEETNRLQYLTDFPWYSNESCDSVRTAIPVVDCPGSVCIKAIIKEPPAKRDVCVETGAVVRDCWSRVMRAAGDPHTMDPVAKDGVLRLTTFDINSTTTIGYIYTCHGLLCNSSSQSSFYLILSSIYCVYYFYI